MIIVFAFGHQETANIIGDFGDKEPILVVNCYQVLFTHTNTYSLLKLPSGDTMTNQWTRNFKDIYTLEQMLLEGFGDFRECNDNSFLFLTLI